MDDSKPRKIIQIAVAPYGTSTPSLYALWNDGTVSRWRDDSNGARWMDLQEKKPSF